MSEYNLSSKQENLIFKLLLAILLAFVVLIIVRYFVGINILKDSEEYLESLKRVFFQAQQPALSEPVFKITDPRLGSSEAEHLIVMFADFQCPYCADSFEVLMNLVAKYPNNFVIVWKDLANPLHPQATSAAVAARCAQNQGNFWDYSAYLFANQESLGDKLYLGVAENLDLNLNEFNQCYSAQQTLTLVNDGYNEGQSLLIDGTPYFFINGQRKSGLISLAELEKVLE